MSKTLIYEDKDMRLEEEIVGEVVFIHLSVSHFNKEVLQRMRRIFNTLKRTYLEDGYEEIFAATPSTKFCKMIDNSLKVLDEVQHGGEKLEVVVWDLK